jgi:Uma2 family endonuclease
MSVTIQRPWTVETFLAWEERQETRFEFNGTAPVAMVGGTEEHALLQAALVSEIRARLRGTPCRVVGSELKLRVNDRIRYPDAMILCAPRRPGRTVVDDPVIVFEILSPSSARTDFFIKNQEYRSNPAIQRYVILTQTHRSAVAFFRADEMWAVEVANGTDATLRLPEVGIDLPLAELYRDIEVEPDEDPPDASHQALR